MFQQIESIIKMVYRRLLSEIYINIVIIEIFSSSFKSPQFYYTSFL